MPTRDAYAVAFLALLIFFVAFNLQSGWVYAVDALLVGLLLAGFLSAQHAVWRVSVSRSLPAEAVAGAPLRVGLRLRAGGLGRRFLVEVLDSIPGLQPGTAVVAAVHPREGAGTSYLTTAVRRGIHRVTAVTVRSRGLSGLFEARREVPAAGEITVYPRYWKIARFSLAAWTPALHSAGSTRRRGGLEFHSLRDYRSGDSVRHVHWRSSARRGALMVREFEEELPGSVMLVIDTRPGVQAGGEVENTFEDLIRAAASITWYVTSRGGTVRLLASTPSGPLDLTGAWKPALRALAELQPGGLAAPEAVLSAAALGRDTAIIVLSPDAGSLRAVAASGLCVAGIVTDPDSYAEKTTGGFAGQIETHGLAACILRRGDDIGARLEEGG